MTSKLMACRIPIARSLSAEGERAPLVGGESRVESFEDRDCTFQGGLTKWIEDGGWPGARGFL
jgi:hypothetical protein